MNDPERGVRLDQFMTSARWLLAVIVVLACISFVIILAGITDARKQTIEAVGDMRKQIEILRDQNHWSIEDRRDLHETQGAIREALKRMEARK